MHILESLYHELEIFEAIGILGVDFPVRYKLTMFGCMYVLILLLKDQHSISTVNLIRDKDRYNNTLYSRNNLALNQMIISWLTYISHLDQQKLVHLDLRCSPQHIYMFRHYVL